MTLDVIYHCVRLKSWSMSWTTKDLAKYSNLQAPAPTEPVHGVCSEDSTANICLKWCTLAKGVSYKLNMS